MEKVVPTVSFCLSLFRASSFSLYLDYISPILLQNCRYIHNLKGSCAFCEVFTLTSCFREANKDGLKITRLKYFPAWFYHWVYCIVYTSQISRQIRRLIYNKAASIWWLFQRKLFPFFSQAQCCLWTYRVKVRSFDDPMKSSFLVSMILKSQAQRS